MRQIDTAESWTALEDTSEEDIIIVATRDELAVIAGSIGEAVQEIEEWEFDTRVGVTSTEARALRDKINSILRVSVDHS